MCSAVRTHGAARYRRVNIRKALFTLGADSPTNRPPLLKRVANDSVAAMPRLRMRRKEGTKGMGRGVRLASAIWLMNWAYRCMSVVGKHVIEKFADNWVNNGWIICWFSWIETDRATTHGNGNSQKSPFVDTFRWRKGNSRLIKSDSKLMRFVFAIHFVRLDQSSDYLSFLK